jgi:hypothetical protein
MLALQPAPNNILRYAEIEEINGKKLKETVPRDCQILSLTSTQAGLPRLQGFKTFDGLL